MIRKAETLSSKNELELSNKVCNFIEQRNMSLDELVLTGRMTAINFALHPGSVANEQRWKRQLVSALDEAGFIRHDFDLRTYRVWELYSAILLKDDFPEMRRLESLTNQDYEELIPVSDGDFEKVKEVLSLLPSREKTVIELRLGLYTEKQYSLKELGEELTVSGQRVKHLQDRALRRLRRPNHLRELPPLFGFALPERSLMYLADGVMNPKASIDELDLSARARNALRRANICSVNDILNYPKENWPKVRLLGAKSMKEVVEKIRAVGYPDFSMDPYYISPEERSKTPVYLADGVMNPEASIDELGLSTRSYNALRHAGIHSVGDILNYPEEKWPKIENLGHRSMKEVAEKIRTVGYPEFSTNPYYIPPEKNPKTPVYLADGVMNPEASIDELGLSARVYNTLRYAGIRSVDDILNYPEEKWPRIRNLGPKSMKEVVEKIRAAGYPRFCIGFKDVENNEFKKLVGKLYEFENGTAKLLDAETVHEVRVRMVESMNAMLESSSDSE